MARVVVVGGGLAGAWAAISAARAGVEVTLVRRAPGATAMSSGAIDLVPPAEAADPAAWLDRLPQRQPGHPYLAGVTAPGVAELGREAAALAAALGAASLPLAVALDDAPLLAAATGQVRRAGVAQASIATGDLRGRRGLVLVAGIAGLHRVDAGAVAAALAERVPGLRTAAATLPPPPAATGGDLDEPGLARALEAGGGAEALGAALAAAAARHGSVDVALLPAVIGLEDPLGTRERLVGAAGVAVAELLSPPPSVPGWRLHRALERATAAAGVLVVTASVEALRTRDGRITAAVTSAGEVACDAAILAGGRFLGGGLSDDPRPREPLLGLTVFADGRPVDALAAGDLSVRTRFRDQPVLRAGLRVDDGARPVDRFGRAPYANLHACGAILDGVDTTLDRGGLGVCLWTAAVAARAALAGIAEEATA